MSHCMTDVEPWMGLIKDVETSPKSLPCHAWRRREEALTSVGATAALWTLNVAISWIVSEVCKACVLSSVCYGIVADKATLGTTARDVLYNQKSKQEQLTLHSEPEQRYYFVR